MNGLYLSDFRGNRRTQYVLRGLGVFGIVFYHVAVAQAITDNFTGVTFTALVHASLRLFFYLSGIGIGLEFVQNHVRFTLYRVLRFYWKRLWAILPLYFVVILFIIMRVGWHAISNETWFQVFTFSLDPNSAPLSIGYLWFISSLMHFYLVAPCIAVISVSLNNVYRWFLPVGIFSLSIIGVCYRIFVASSMPYPTLYASFGTNIDVFIVGIMFGIWLNSLKVYLSSKLKQIITLLVLISILGYLFVFGQTVFEKYYMLIQSPIVIGIFPFIVCLGSSIILFLYHNAKEHNNPVDKSLLQTILYFCGNILALFGKYSLEMYLIHVQLLEYYNGNCGNSCTMQTMYLTIGEILIVTLCLSITVRFIVKKVFFIAMPRWLRYISQWFLCNCVHVACSKREWGKSKLHFL